MKYTKNELLSLKASDMTLLDYFAAKALPACIAAKDICKDYEIRAVDWAYNLADEMLEAKLEWLNAE